MSIITRMRKQTCVYWAPASPAYDEFGKTLYDDPVQLSCRWQTHNVLMQNEKGEEFTSRALVFVANVVVAGVLMLGTLSDVTESRPLDNTDAWEIQAIEKIPNLRNTETLWKVYL